MKTQNTKRGFGASALKPTRKEKMKTQNTKQAFGSSARKPLLAAAILVLLVATSPAQAAERNPNRGILPVGSTSYGKTYAEWSALLWQHAIELPVEGNPFVDGGCFELSGPVWFLSAPLSMGEHSCTVPSGRALFVPTLTIECSSLESPDSGFHGDTEEEQRACAKFWADHIVNLSVEIEGVPVRDLVSYRVVSPQFSFTAPDPNILGVPGGGAGTAVADGYYLMLAPLSKGGHTIRLRGALHLSVAAGDPFDFALPSDVTFNIAVE